MQTEGSEKLNPKRQQAEEARRMSPAAPFPCLQREAAVAALSARSTDSDEHQTRTMCWVLAAPPHSVQSAARPPEEYEDEEEGKQSGGQAVHRSVDNRWDGLMAPGGPRGISRS